MTERGRTAIAMFVARLGLFVVFGVLGTGCSTGHFGAFSDTTYYDAARYRNIRELGPAHGESCQTLVLYVFPYESPPSTAAALQAAMTQYEKTVFLGNVAIQSHQNWFLGYSRVCTVVTGTAYTAEPVDGPSAP